VNLDAISFLALIEGQETAVSAWILKDIEKD
jgi:hypothetical protein